jgi:deoxyribodipyrimidine photo-lyase
MEYTVFWHRRDLRLDDNAGLYHALKSGANVMPIFIFDKNILDHLPQNDARVQFIHQNITKLQQQLTTLGSAMQVYYGTPQQFFFDIIKKYDIKKVITNHDYEPYAVQRDAQIAEYLLSEGVAFETYKDTVLMERNEVMKDDGKPYTVFTPYKNKWLKTITPYQYQSYNTQKYWKNLWQTTTLPVPTLANMGFEEDTQRVFAGNTIDENIVRSYDQTRNFPAVRGTTRLSVHLRFGTISIRQLAQRARVLNETYLNELIWRDFYQMIIHHFPKSAHSAFKPAYDNIEWRNSAADFERWCVGNTGYALVDAGMRELNATGFMHNRVRMVVASFLTKHLLLDWRLGEAYFAQKLLDFELASNNGGWQWAAGCGCDAAPYFRVFNPSEQLKKFDTQGEYVRRWVPEYGTMRYAQPMVEHTSARNRAIATYKKALTNDVV